ncbi:MAG: carboxypeptidase-like regulatory domain-containing protein [Candidatus Sulfotelmatobacter sp.]
MAWLPFHDDSPGWLLRWIQYVGGALLGAVFLVGTIVALRNRKRAGIIFLSSMPVAVFCLAYPSAGYLVWHSDGSGWFEPPEIPTAIGLTILFFLLIFAGLLAIRHKKRAVYLFAVIALLAGIVFSRSHWTKAFLPPFAGRSALFLIFGLFWLETNKLGWPALLQPRLRSLGQRCAAVALTCIVVVCVDVMVTFGLAALGSSLFSADCGGAPPSVRPRSEYHAVFTSRIIFVGRSIEALTRGPNGFLSSRGYDARVGDWAIGVVHEKFWGLPFWTPRLVLLTNFVYWKDETYFVDGSRGHGLLSERLPIVEAGLCGGRTRPVRDAIVDLRLLHERAATGTRLIGYVREPEKFVHGLVPPVPPKLAVGAKISITGPSGTRIITTDPSGVYEVDGLPPGDYTLQLLAPNGHLEYRARQISQAKVRLDDRGPVEQNFALTAAEP